MRAYFWIILFLLAGCGMDAERATGVFDSIILEDGTRCVVYVVPLNQIKGLSCNFGEEK